MGFDSREITPQLTRAVVHLSAEVRSFERAEIATDKVLGNKVPQSTIRRVTQQVGTELADQHKCEQRNNAKEVAVPLIAVVSCDGGRIRTRKPHQGRNVVLSGEKGWRETKNASFEKMSPATTHKWAPNVQHQVEDSPLKGEQTPSESGKFLKELENDPCEALPTSFRTAAKVAKIVEKPVPKATDTEAASGGDERVVYQGPQRVLRTVLSSMACSDDFGPMMQREAKRRRFYEASLRAFVGDGLNWNWSIWKSYFPTFVPILDFIHAIQYVFCAAMAMTPCETEGWSVYVRLITLCWQGRVDDVIEQLQFACNADDIDWEEEVADDHPYAPLVAAIRYLSNNRTRMDYPRYRRLGLPISSAPMESLVKQINHRAKGTEMFWDDPEGGDAILHVRAAALSEDDRLDDHLSKRPGWPLHRRTSQLDSA